MAIEIELLHSPEVPLEVENLRPDLFEAKSLMEIQKELIFHGKQQCQVGDFFRVSGNPADQVHRWKGDFSKVHWIGAKMEAGEIWIEGQCGRHLGSEMSGGQITVSGDCSDWVGAEMQGGLIRVGGNAGHLVGSAYRGSPIGMIGGSILIEGKAGNEVGHTMRRGLIAVGSAGDLAGFNMLAGTLLIFGDAGIRHGAGMRRGTIGFFGPNAPTLLPTFRYACRQQLSVLTVLQQQLTDNGYPMKIPGTVDLYHGDFMEGGRGEILISAT